jgi:hypothetical protein
VATLFSPACTSFGIPIFIAFISHSRMVLGE